MIGASTPSERVSSPRPDGSDHVKRRPRTQGITSVALRATLLTRSGPSGVTFPPHQRANANDFVMTSTGKILRALQRMGDPHVLVIGHSSKVADEDQLHCRMALGSSDREIIGDSTGRRNTSIAEVLRDGNQSAVQDDVADARQGALTGRALASARASGSVLGGDRSRPVERRGASATGVASGVGARWFRQCGGMPPFALSPLSGHPRSLTEREEIDVLNAHSVDVCEMARRLQRVPSAISRELRRNPATRTGSSGYRAPSRSGMPSG